MKYIKAALSLFGLAVLLLALMSFVYAKGRQSVIEEAWSVCQEGGAMFGGPQGIYVCQRAMNL